MPRRWAWLLFVVAAVLFFLAALKDAGTASSLPAWLADGGLCALAIGCAAWAFPAQPPTVP